MSEKKRDDETWHDKKRAEIQKLRERLKRIDRAMKRKNFRTIDQELREWRREIEESKED